ncbi:MAG: glycerophosphoryl diester phosphodiesterase membrane domain-containing protein [Lachnospiraceae bacterium]|nr:glycerophosphoryl diester phosphodiesterase membrane domain-containing protein [Lachnospiraceae bacterium]
MEQKKISYGRLIYEALPEMWGFQIIVSILVAIPMWLFKGPVGALATVDGVAVTTANMKGLLLSWRFPVLLVIGIAVVIYFIVMELFAQICLCDDILQGKGAGVRRELKRGFKSVKKFLTPMGIGVLAYIFIAVPLCGLGFSISLTKEFHIPNFIMDVVLAKPLYAIGYFAGIIALLWFGFHGIFTLHAVLIDGMTPSEGRRRSVEIVKKNRWTLIWGMIKVFIIVFLIQLGINILFNIFLGGLGSDMGETLPKNYTIDIFSGKDLTDTEIEILAYRVASAITIILGKYINAIVVLLTGTYVMLSFTKFYFEFTRGEFKEYLERPKKSRYTGKVVASTLLFVVLIALSFLVGLLYDRMIARQEPVKCIAHRTGGTMASENSVEGLELAIQHGCYGSETDIHRTLDGYYIINHDNDFKRLTGVAKAPKDMTLDEIEKLEINDTTGNGQKLKVPTLEELLDVTKDSGTRLFIEFKGATADEKEADDVARMIKERDMVDDVAIISLDYNIIDYTETHYPELMTGTLFFAGLGDITNLNCDLLIMEEEIATDATINLIHAANKMAVVWTVNTRNNMSKFQDSDVDAIITDEIEMFEEVEAEHNDRTDFEAMEARLGNMFD